MPTPIVGVDSDCQKIIRRCNEIVRYARAVRAYAALGDAENLRFAVGAMTSAANRVSQIADVLYDTTDHLGDT